MPIEFNTQPYVQLKGKEPRGRHLWRFVFVAEGIGKTAMSIDGEWPKAKAKAFERAKKFHKRDVVEVYPF